MITIGIVANPASGKDIRRLVARASVFDNPEKQAIVRRALAGMHSVLAGTPWRVAYLDDTHGIVRRAADELFKAGEANSPAVEAVMSAETASAIDTTRAARALAEIPSTINLTLGGDGTNRAFALGWPDAPLIPISTGTNNVFPGLMEATIAGAAAGVIAAGAVQLGEVAQQQKLIRISIDNEPDDLALVDAVLVADRFIGARALLTPDNLRSALLTIADPAAVGITAIGGLITPLARETDQALQLEFDPAATNGRIVSAPIAPGYYREVRVTECRQVALSQCLRCRGPGVLAFDGERERVLKPDQTAILRVERAGPVVVDVAATMRLAAERGCFTRPLSVDR
jgi:hypothetical protein